MRIGIDCRTYGPSHGYMGKYMENLVSYLEQNEDANEYILFLGDREFGEFVPKSSRFHAVKTPTKMGSLSEQVFFPYELYAHKLDIVLFSRPHSPIFYFKKTITILSDLVPYFYPEKHLK